MLLHPLLIARALGIDTGAESWSAVRNAVEAGDRFSAGMLPLEEIEHAIAARLADEALREAGSPWRITDDDRVVTVRAPDGDEALRRYREERALEPGAMESASVALADLHTVQCVECGHVQTTAAGVATLICTSAACAGRSSLCTVDGRIDLRAILATGLLADLCGGGFPWGAPPREDYALCVARAAPWARDLTDEGDGPYAGLCVARPEGADVDYVSHGSPVYASAHHVISYLLGMSTNEQTPDEVHERAVELAIALLGDEKHSVAEITAGAASWLLATWQSSWTAARARRMCASVGVRFPLPQRS